MMYLLYKKFKNSEKVVEADILNIVSKDDKTYSFYNQKIQEEKEIIMKMKILVYGKEVSP